MSYVRVRGCSYHGRFALVLPSILVRTVQHALEKVGRELLGLRSVVSVQLVLPQPHLRVIQQLRTHLVMVVEIVLHLVLLLLHSQRDILDKPVRPLERVRDLRIVVGDHPNRWLGNRDACLRQEGSFLRRLRHCKYAKRGNQNGENGVASFPHKNSYSTTAIRFNRSRSSSKSGHSKTSVTYAILQIIQICSYSVSVLADKRTICG